MCYVYNQWYDIRAPLCINNMKINLTIIKCVFTFDVKICDIKQKFHFTLVY